MRLGCLILLWTMFAACLSLQAQTSSPPPQTARQALIEMFLSKNPEDFAKHLPDAARQSLIHKGETPESSFVLRISQIGRQMGSSGEHIETFETGPNILVSEQNDGHERVEIAVEHDSLLGEEDEIELSVHFYKDGQTESLPVLPRLTFMLKQEKEIWRLTEVTAAAHVPLTDPDYLKGLRKQQEEANETAAQMRVNVIAGAEAGYAAKHPDQGFTCSLASLFAHDPAGASGEGEGLYDPGQGSEEWNGYHFTLSACDGSPASKYRILAEPVDPGTETKTFCSDQSGTLKSVTSGKGPSCFSRGQVVNTQASGGISLD
jgi:type IV pilus assembly protein PilA